LFKIGALLLVMELAWEFEGEETTNDQNFRYSSTYILKNL